MISIPYVRVFRTLFLSVGLCSLFGLAACTTAKMACPPECSVSAVEMPVTGRQGFGLSESFLFGPYHVSDVHRGWRVTTSWGILGYGSSKSEQPFEFKLSAPDGAIWQAHCATGVRRNALLKKRRGGGKLIPHPRESPRKPRKKRCVVYEETACSSSLVLLIAKSVPSPLPFPMLFLFPTEPFSPYPILL